METKIFKNTEIFKNKEDGVQSELKPYKEKFHVRFKDIDADLYLPQTRIFNNYYKAKIYAKKLVGQE